MNITIYEAVAKYKKDDTLPYTEKTFILRNLF